MWLTEDEVRELTGYKLPAYQRKWLEEHRKGLRFSVNRKGRIIIARDDIVARRPVQSAKKEPMRFPWETASASPSRS